MVPSKQNHIGLVFNLIVRFQNGCNKVAIELWVVKSNPFDFEITHMISDQIALHSVQLPLLFD